jgi:hypothetical protein
MFFYGKKKIIYWILLQFKKEQCQSFRLTLSFNSGHKSIGISLAKQSEEPELPSPMILPNERPVADHSPVLLAVQQCGEGRPLSPITPGSQEQAHERIRLINPHIRHIRAGRR